MTVNMLAKWWEKKKVERRDYKRRLNEELIILGAKLRRHLFKYNPKTRYELWLVIIEFLWVGLILSVIFLPIFYFEPKSIPTLLLPFVTLIVIVFFLSKQGSWMYWNGKLGQATVTEVEDKTTSKSGIKMKEGIIHYHFHDHLGRLHHGKQRTKLFARKFPIVGDSYRIMYDPGEPADHQIHFTKEAERIVAKYTDLQERKLRQSS